MPRAARIMSTTGYYHIIMRGQNKEYIFKSEVHKEYFMRSLNIIEKEEKLSIVAWCLMDNHVHLIIKTEPEMLAIVFKRLNIKYAMYYYRRNKSLGHVFQDRFISEPIESDKYLMNVIRYVHSKELNDDQIKLKELLIELSEKNGLSKKQIAAEYGLSISRV